eukprot:2272099-Amphidinium_carterae.1
MSSLVVVALVSCWAWPYDAQFTRASVRLAMACLAAARTCSRMLLSSYVNEKNSLSPSTSIANQNEEKKHI